jgi:hypothetical protein
MRHGTRKTSHAKAQRREGAKKTTPLFFAAFATWRLCVKLFIFSHLHSLSAQQAAKPQVDPR